MVTALELAEADDEKPLMLRGLRDDLERQICQRYPDAVVHGCEAPRAPHISSFAIPGVKARRKQKELDRAGISVGLGSACTGCNNKVSHVLEAMDVEPHIAEATLRFSLGWNSAQQHFL